MTGNMCAYVVGLGTAVNQPKGLANMARGKNTGFMTMAIPKPETVTLDVRSILPMVQKLGLGIADLTKCVAKMGLNLSELQEEVVVRTPESMLNKCVSTPLPKTPNFKSKKKTSKVALPD